MKSSILGIICLFVTAAGAQSVQNAATVTRSAALKNGGGKVVVPMASVQKSTDVGLRAHSHVKIFVPAGLAENQVGFAATKTHPNGTPVLYYYAETPASLACMYGLTTWVSGCNPYSLANSAHATGGSKAIAIVDAYHYPTALADLNAYSTQFGLPTMTTSTFIQTNTGSVPKVDPDCANYGGYECWALESALDIEMAHAMAPSAKIYLVEAASNSYVHLYAAIAKAVTLVQAAGGGEISLSWGGSEFSGETAYDANMSKTNVVFFASTGDSEGTEFPSVSPNVVAVGGTTLMRNPSTLAIEAETAWEDSGGGISSYETRPSYQSSISGTVGSYRGVPDVAAVANPRTGVWVYDSYYTSSYTNGPWAIVGGTSAASPIMAAIVNNAGSFAANTATELAKIYAADAMSPNWRDITYGSCGYYQGWYAKSGWDPCTGKAAPYGKSGK